MDRFLPYEDELGRVIQEAAERLHARLQNIDVDELGMPAHCLSYFKLSHSTRLFFSIETSAHLLYRSIRLTGKKTADITVMDYGAGVGTLFLLAKMIGCGKVIYNDHLEDWKKSAELIAAAIDVQIDLYIVGDIDQCLQELRQKNIECNIITSRNVIEHIYKLDKFYSAIQKYQPAAIIFSSTTANMANPASVIKHVRWHRKWEKVYYGMRVVDIQRHSPGMAADKVKTLATATRGLAAEDLQQAIQQYRETGELPDPTKYGSNTCDPANGVWAEHLISTAQYKGLIDEKWYNVSFEPGFWDTHYRKSYKNALSKLLNKLISARGSRALGLAPFMYVIARPRKK